MKYEYKFRLILLWVLIILIASCSKSRETLNPVIPSDVNNQAGFEIPGNQLDDSGNHDLLGSWIMNYDPDDGSISILPDRKSQMHFNIKTMIPAPVIQVNSYDPVEEILDVDVTIQNPFPISGYDVRLIIYTDSVGHTLKNADNWTPLYDIAGGLPINPFKAYAKSEPDRLFPGQSQQTENLLIKMPGGNFAVNFAIDASYPTNCEEPYRINNMIQEEILYDQPNSRADVHINVYQWDTRNITVSLNCPQVFGITIIELDSDDNEYFYGELVNYQGAPAGEYPVYIEANSGDPLSLYSIDTVYVTEKPVVGWVEKFDGREYVYGLETDTSGNAIVGLQTHQLTSISKDKVEQWTKLTNAGPYYDISYEPTFGYIYFTGVGEFCGTYSGYDGIGGGKCYQEDPDDIIQKSSCPGYDASLGAIIGDDDGTAFCFGHFRPKIDPMFAVLYKVDSDLNIVFTRTFDQSDGSLGFSNLMFSDFDSIYTSGAFMGTYVDLDPGSGSMILNPVGEQDGFVAEYLSNGAFSKVRRWGGYNDPDAVVKSRAMGNDPSGNVYISGTFEGTVDFDPSGFGYEIKSSTGNLYDLYISKFNSNLGYEDCMSLHSSDYIFPRGIALDLFGNIYICGSFRGDVDFDPGFGTANRHAMGSAFIAKYSPTFDYQWVRIFWNEAELSASTGVDVAYDTIYNMVYLTGTFYGTIDFDPSDTGVYELSSPGVHTAFLLKLTPEGLWM